MNDPRQDLFVSITQLRAMLRFAHERRHIPDQQAVLAQKIEQALGIATRLMQHPVFADLAVVPTAPAPKKPVAPEPAAPAAASPKRTGPLVLPKRVRGSGVV